MNETFRSIVDATAVPRIVRLSENLYAAVFVLMKILPARFMLEQARRDGLLRPKSVVIETSSGTFGLALAMLCRLHDYRLILVSDPAIAPPLHRRLKDLGAGVEIVTAPARVGGYQGARLQRMAELRDANPGHFWPSQYHNAHNPGAYAPLAELLSEVVGAVDCLVGTVGSGGSMCGSTRYLRSVAPSMWSVGVDTLGSVLFGQPDSLRLLRGLGNSLMPGNLDHTVFDEVHWVGAPAAFVATRDLHREHAMYMGPTSGAAYLVARWYARTHPKENVVVIFPDEGYRYQDTVYDDDWLRREGALLTHAPHGPAIVTNPAEAVPPWTSLAWGRRTYEQVVGAPFASPL
jgi:cysteine synthase A